MHHLILAKQEDCGKEIAWLNMGAHWLGSWACSGHVAHASLRGDAWIHYYLVMDFTDNDNQTISNR